MCQETIFEPFVILSVFVLKKEHPANIWILRSNIWSLCPPAAVVQDQDPVEKQLCKDKPAPPHEDWADNQMWSFLPVL